MDSDGLSFDSNIPFHQARQYAAPYLPRRPYFVDWLVELLHGLKRGPSPFDYACRIHMAEEILGRVNPDHPMAAEKTLRRVIRNLFPYNLDAKRAKMSKEMEGFLLQNDYERLEMNRPSFAPLDDRAIPSKLLVSKRYRLLMDAFVTYAKLRVENLEKDLDEETVDLESGEAIVAYHMGKVNPLLDEIATMRETMYTGLSKSDLRCVNMAFVAEEQRKEVKTQAARSSAEGGGKNRLTELEKQAQDSLQAIMQRGRDLANELDKKKKKYDKKTQELVGMATLIQEFLKPEFMREFQESIQRLDKRTASKFAYQRYMPKDLIDGLKKGCYLYKDGWL